jgi:hypothetical protein
MVKRLPPQLSYLVSVTCVDRGEGYSTVLCGTLVHGRIVKVCSGVCKCGADRSFGIRARALVCN